MMGTSNNNQLSRTGTIANNTILLYIRMLILMVINLYTVRLVLLALGVENYGIYSAVAGVVTMLNCVNSVMSNATQRFYSFYIGKNDHDNLNKVFSASLDVYILIIAIVIILGESVGLWFVNSKLVIPEERLGAANIAYHFSLLSFSCALISMPYLSAILAHEKIGVYSIFTTIEYLLKLGLALLLSIMKGDVLILYASFELIAQLFLMMAYIFYGKKHLSECKYHGFKRNGMHKEIVTFSSWTLFGSIAGIGMNQVMTILYNIFFGPIVTACRAISLQLNTALTAFSNSFITALRPPMIKSYSENNTDYLMKLFYIGNKFVFYSLAMIAIPLIFEMRTVLGLWLNVTDDLTVNYARLVVIYFIIMAIGNPITIIIQAIGKVKEYYLKVEVFTLLCPLITYLLFKAGCNSYFGYFVMIVTLSLSHITRLVCLKKLFPPFMYVDYISHFCLPAIVISSVITIIVYFAHIMFSGGIIKWLTLSLLSAIMTLLLVYIFNLNKNEKKQISMMLQSLKIKLLNKK